MPKRKRIATMILLTILNTIIMFLIYIAIFAIIYGFIWGFTRNYFVRIKVYYQAMIGATFAILAVLGQGLIHAILPTTANNIVVFYLPIIVCTVLSVFISWIGALAYMIIEFLCIFMLPAALPMYFVKIDDAGTVVTVIILFAANIVVSLLGLWRKWKWWTKWSLISLLSFIGASIMIIMKYLNAVLSPESMIAEMDVLIWIVLSYVAYALCWTEEMIYLHATKLQNIIEYDHYSYVREALAHRTIYSIISQKKIKRGMYVTFAIQNIDDLESIISSDFKERIIDSITSQIVHIFNNKEIIFFKADKNNFGFFIPIADDYLIDLSGLAMQNFAKNLKANSPFKEIEQKMKSIITVFKLRNYEISTNLRTYISFYGIQSNNLDVLKNYNLIIAHNHTNLGYHNKVIVIDTDAFRKIGAQNRTLLALNQAISLENITTLFYPIIGIQPHKITSQAMLGHYAINLVDGTDINRNMNDLDPIFLKSNFKATLSRLNAASNVRKYESANPAGEHLLFINYDANYVGSSEFVPSNFFAKLELMGISQKHLVLVFDLNDHLANLEILAANIKELRSQHIKIGLKNLGATNVDYRLLAYYQPDFGFINEDVVKAVIFHLHNNQLIDELRVMTKKLRIKLIAPYVHSYTIYQKMRKLKVDYMFGDLIGNEYEPVSLIKEEILYLLNKNRG